MFSCNLESDPEIVFVDQIEILVGVTCANAPSIAGVARFFCQIEKIKSAKKRPIKGVFIQNCVQELYLEST
jgi:hypothetical protein